jgi:hypothetical protein
VNTKTLANHYSQLSAEERFRLILAACSRNDEAEADRLRNVGKRIALSILDHSPYVDAFQDLLFVNYIDLLEDAALYLESIALRDKQLCASIEAAKTPKRKKTMPLKTDSPTLNGDAVVWPDWHLTGRTVYGVGFLFKMKLEGWKLFCNRLNVSAVALWEQMDLAGLDRLKTAWAQIHAGAVFPSAAAMTCWVNEVRPASDPEYSEADIVTAEWIADWLGAEFRGHVKRCGG